VLAAEDTRRAVLTTLVSDVATAYLSYRPGQELELAQRTLALRQQSLQLIKLRRQGGVARIRGRQGEQLGLPRLPGHPGHAAAARAAENQPVCSPGQTTAAVAARPPDWHGPTPRVAAGALDVVWNGRTDPGCRADPVAANANIGVQGAYFSDIV